MQYFLQMYNLLPDALKNEPFKDYPAKVTILLEQISEAIEKDPQCIVQSDPHVMGLLGRLQKYFATIYGQYLQAYAGQIIQEQFSKDFPDTDIVEAYQRDLDFQEVCTMYLHMKAKKHENTPLAKKIIDDYLNGTLP